MSASNKEGEIRLYSNFPILYAWPVMLMGWVLNFLVGENIVGNTTAAWVYYGTFVLVLLTFGFDIDKTALVIIVLAVGIVLTGGALLRDVHNIDLLKWPYEWLFANFKPAYSPNWAGAISRIILVLIVTAITMTWWAHRWTIGYNNVQRDYVVDEANFPKEKYEFELHYGDLLELILLLGGGTIRIKHEKNIVMEIPHIMFLWFRHDEVKKILETKAVIVTTSASHDDHSHH